MTTHYAKIVDKYIGEEMDRLYDLYDVEESWSSWHFGKVLRNL